MILPPPKPYYKIHPPPGDVFYSMVLEKVLHIALRCVVLFPKYTTPTVVGVAYSCFSEGKFRKIAPPLVLHIASRCVVSILPDVFYIMVSVRVLHIALRCVVLFPLGVVYSCFNEGKFGKIAPPLIDMTYLLG